MVLSTIFYKFYKRYLDLKMIKYQFQYFKNTFTYEAILKM